jgi:hypothetical protein
MLMDHEDGDSWLWLPLNFHLLSQCTITTKYCHTHVTKSFASSSVTSSCTTRSFLQTLLRWKISSQLIYLSVLAEKHKAWVPCTGLDTVFPLKKSYYLFMNSNSVTNSKFKSCMLVCAHMNLLLELWSDQCKLQAHPCYWFHYRCP